MASRRAWRLSSIKLVSREVQCPLCSTTFRHSSPKSGTYSLVRRDSDLCPHYSGVNPFFYLVYVCPGCHFSAYREDFQAVEEPETVLAALKRANLGQAVDFRQPERSLFAALRSFELAKVCYEARKFPLEVLASLSHRAAWICRMAGELGREVRYLTEARELYKAAFEGGVDLERKTNDLTVAYLIGDLMLRTGEISSAQPYFMMVAQADDARPTTLKSAKDRLHDSKEVGKIKAFLEGIDLFHPIGHLLGVMAAISEKRSLTHGMVLCRKGDPGTSMFVVSSGQARIFLGDPDHSEPVAVLGPGEYFGEMSLFLGQPRSATVLAGATTPKSNSSASALEVVEIPKTAFRNLLKLEAEVMDALADKIALRKHQNDEWQERYERQLPQAAPAETEPAEGASLHSLILPKIRSLFGLGTDDPDDRSFYDPDGADFGETPSSPMAGARAQVR